MAENPTFDKVVSLFEIVTDGENHVSWRQNFFAKNGSDERYTLTPQPANVNPGKGLYGQEIPLTFEDSQGNRFGVDIEFSSQGSRFYRGQVDSDGVVNRGGLVAEYKITRQPYLLE